MEWNYVAALESESEGIEAFVTNKTTLRVLKKRESEVRAKRPPSVCRCCCCFHGGAGFRLQAFVFDLLSES